MAVGALAGAGAAVKDCPGAGGGAEVGTGAVKELGTVVRGGVWTREGSPPRALIVDLSLLSLSPSIRSDDQLGRLPRLVTGPHWFQKSLAWVRSPWH